MDAPLPVVAIADPVARAEAIVNQVDYYFSPASIKGSTHLQGIIADSAHNNYLIPIGEIARFKRLADLFPSVRGESGPKAKNIAGKKEIMAALQTSKTVNVVGTTHIRRKVDDEDSDDGNWNEDDKKKLFVAPAVQKPSKKMIEATGWETGFADAPITPAEHHENLECYDPARAVHDRIEVAIQRFKARRKFHISHSNAFNSWLKFGGVETGERKFNGRLDKKDELAGMSAFDKAVQFATHQVGDEKSDKTRWALDFEGVAKAYLSSEFSNLFFDPEIDQIQLQCTVMTNFYNYLMHHSVCPEYTDEILAARSIVAQGQKELIAIHNLGSVVPGDFNVACSVLLEGNLAGSHSSDISWNPNTKDLMSTEKARIIVATAFTSDLGGDELFQAVFGSDIESEPSRAAFTKELRMPEAFTLGLEVVDKQCPTNDDIQGYEAANKAIKGISKNMVLKPLGKLVCKPWKIPKFEDHDLPKHLRNETFKHAPKTYTFWLEDDILEHVFMGMKMSAEVRRLEVQGFKECLWILDGVHNIYCSFYTLILNDLMYRPWKGVRVLTDEEQAAEATDGHDGM